MIPGCEAESRLNDLFAKHGSDRWGDWELQESSKLWARTRRLLLPTVVATLAADTDSGEGQTAASVPGEVRINDAVLDMRLRARLGRTPSAEPPTRPQHTARFVTVSTHISDSGALLIGQDLGLNTCADVGAAEVDPVKIYSGSYTFDAGPESICTIKDGVPVAGFGLKYRYSVTKFDEMIGGLMTLGGMDHQTQRKLEL